MRIAIIGTGNVGTAIGEGLAKKHEVVYGSREPKRKSVPSGAAIDEPSTAAKNAEVVFLAVPFASMKEVIGKIGVENLKGKTVVDVSNIMEKPGAKKVSGAEDIAKMIPDAKVVKAFNTVFAQHMSKGKIGNEKLALFVAGNDAESKNKVKKLAEDIGFDVVDAGDLGAAWYLEEIGLFMISLGYYKGYGPGIGLRLVKS